MPINARVFLGTGLFVLAVLGNPLVSGVTRAEVRLPRLISDHMVLQRDRKIVIWGWAAPGEPLRIDFHGKRTTARADRDGRWAAALGPFPAGGPYDMAITGRNKLMLRDLLIGDVWLASGQSNMQFPIKGSAQRWQAEVFDADKELAAAHFEQIRLFMVEHKTAFAPQQDLVSDAGWRPVTPQTVGDFSAVAYFFGRDLQQRYHVPIGLIDSTWGGTVAEAWVSEASLRAFPEFREAIDTVNQANGAGAEIERYKQDKKEWYASHATEDRGRVDGKDLWAEASFDVSTWPTVNVPQMKAQEALKGFDGVVWFRKDIDIPAREAGKSLSVHLGTNAGATDTTYFNGEQIGDTQGWSKPRDYQVPGNLVKSGRNVIVIRMTGSNGYVGMFDADGAEKMQVELEKTAIPVAGRWSYQPGPDLAALPAPSPSAKLSTSPNNPTLLFNGMVSPLTPFRLKGVIWYQGESNADDHRAAQYRTLFPALIQDWRARWGYPLPFLFVQLAGYGHNKPEPADYSWADLREAQGMALSLPATGMATAVDLGDENDIHPRDKQDVAQRLALTAAKVAYSEDITYSGPTYQSMQVEGHEIRVRFSQLGSGLLIKDKYGYVRGFEIAAADSKFVWARARQDGQDILVFNEQVRQPVAVRYDWSNTPDGNVYNKEGLPALPFRTDARKPVTAQAPAAR